MLKLDDRLLLFKGNVRYVYQHPDDPGKCIKITYNTKKKRSVQREIRYLQKYQSQGKPLDRLPKYYGRLQTNLGRGGVFDLIRDYDGTISKTLSHCVAQNHEYRLTSGEITAELQAMCIYFVENDIIVCDPAPHNIVIHRPTASSFRFVIVDGIGNPHFFKLGDYVSSIARKHILRKWKRYMEDNPSMQDVLVRGGYARYTCCKG